MVSPTDEGTPQGGPLSPLLSNLVLDEFDRELTRRGLRFCRYADDCNIYVRSRRAGERVMASVSRFLTTRLQLKVNESKSAVARPGERKFLGFTISNDGSERQIAAKALEKFKERVRELTRRTSGSVLPQVVAPLRPYLIGWRGYFGFCQTPHRAHQPRRVDSSPTTHVSLATVEERAESLQGTAPTEVSQVPRGGRCRFTDWVLAHVRPCGGAKGTAQPRLRLDRPSSTLCCPLKLNPIEPPWYGPVCPVVWEGRSREAPPYPDH